MVRTLKPALGGLGPLLAAGLLALAGPAPARADSMPLKDGVIGIAVNYDDVMGLSMDISAGDDCFGVDEAVLVVGAVAQTTQPADPAYAFLGAGAGNPVWVLPQNPAPDLIWLGADTTSIPYGTFDIYHEADARVNRSGEWIKITLLGVRGPGVFSVWSTNFDGRPIVWMTSSHNITDSDAVFVITNAENRYNFGFSSPGHYKITFKASAMLGGMETESEWTTYRFHVKD